MRKLIYLILLLFTSLVMGYAVPAKRHKTFITLTDGFRKEVCLQGDENMHFYVDATDETTCYQMTGDGTYERVESHLIREAWQERLEQRNAVREARLSARRRAAASSAAGPLKSVGTSSVYEGKKKGLILLVNFSDKKMQAAHSRSFYDRYFNEVGFSDKGMAGSVHDYFYSCSYGKFSLSFDVVGPFTVSKRMSHYGSNDSAGSDMYPAEMVIEACKMADKDGVDFSQYDWDGDGYVDQVFVIYAGYAESQGAATTTIWPHEYELSSAAIYGDGTGTLSLDGVKVDTYAVSSELNGSSGTTVDGIGTACHEFSHCLGIPDLYDTKGNAFGLNAWDLMDYGSYNNSSCCPAAFSSYERMFCGWLEPTVLSEGCNVTGMQNLVDEPQAYIVYNEKNHNEYYLLENRQQTGFDKYLPGHGLLVVHVDYDENAWINNVVNTNASHQRVTLIPADNVLTKNDMAGDPWPGTNGNASLTDYSTPAATLFTANSDGRRFMGKPIERITESGLDHGISFVFNGGVKLNTPQGLQTVSVESGAFTARWDAVPNATSYKLLLSEYEGSDMSRLDDMLLINEDFSKLVETSGYTESKDISYSLNKFLNTEGWSGSKIFFTPNRELKFGSSSSEGALYSPFMSTEADHLTLVVSARRYNEKDAGNLIVELDYQKDGVSGYQHKSVATFTLDVTTNTYQCTIELSEDIRKSFRLNLSSSSTGRRIYLSDVKLYAGKYTEAEIAEGLAIGELLEMFEYETDEPFVELRDLPLGRTYTWEVIAINEEEGILSNWSEQLAVSMPVQLGDVDGDGSLTVHDVWGIVQLVAEGDTKGLYRQAADMNQDGNISISDVTILIQQLQ